MAVAVAEAEAEAEVAGTVAVVAVAELAAECIWAVEAAAAVGDTAVGAAGELESIRTAMS